jgi:hypothetical protein
VPLDSVLKVSLRPSALGKGAVLVLQCIASKNANVTIKVTNNDTKEERQHQLVISPGEKTEVGMLEMGWSFEPNETLMIYSGLGIEKPWILSRQGYVLYKSSNGGVGIRKRFFGFPL